MFPIALRHGCLFLMTLAIVGCGQAADQSEVNTGYEASFQAEDSAIPVNATAESRAIGLETQGDLDTGEMKADPADAKLRAAVNVRRQIVYEATLDLVVEDFSATPDRVEALTAQHQGFVASSSLRGDTGKPRRGTWSIRVPAAGYSSFLDEVAELGELSSLTTGAREVTAEYYDVQARIANKQRQEERLLELLAEGTGKLTNVLSVEEHLARVREETERMQGRMRVLRDLTSYSTVTLNIDEIKGYIPDSTSTFGTRVSRAWSGTLSTMSTAGQNLVIGLVALAPWLAVLAVPLWLGLRVVRRVIRQAREFLRPPATADLS
jgi:hypothetical protein